MLPRTSPTKATSGVAIVSAGRPSPAFVSDRRPAPTKATPPGALAGKVCLPPTTHHPRPQKVGKFKKRKVALRLGYLNDNSGHWILRPAKLKELLSGHIKLADLSPNDVKYDIQQKGVDMRIGLDIASMCFKKQVDQIILVAGDSDFVPAAKLARREGIDFILDPMWFKVREDLHTHIDGMRTVLPARGPGPGPTTVTPLVTPPIP